MSLELKGSRNGLLGSLFKRVHLELNLFFLALSFFTRIPVPNSLDYSSQLLNKANRYFSLVGLLLGGGLALSYFILNFFLPISVAVLLMMSLSLLLTGAFHEDGLADMADGIGGAFTVEKRLIIMKDSRIGTYGSVALILVLLLKFSLLVEIAQLSSLNLIVALVLASALSRAVAGSLISSLAYVSDEQSSKSKPLACYQSRREKLVLLTIGALPLLLLPVNASLILIASLVTFQLFFARWLKAKLGGFTGDCLGAAQQISELLIYVLLLGYWSNTYQVSL